MNDPDFRDPEPFPESAADEQDDFAAEHSDTTLADQLPGGPERAEEPDSPKGRAGLD